MCELINVRAHKPYHDSPTKSRARPPHRVGARSPRRALPNTKESEDSPNLGDSIIFQKEEYGKDQSQVYP